MKHKNFNSKNIAGRIKFLIDNNQEALALEIMKAEELKNILPNVLKILKKKNEKMLEFNKTKIFSKTSISKDTLHRIEKALEINTKDAEIIIDKNIGAGVKIKSAGTVVDATFETMLENAITNILK